MAGVERGERIGLSEQRDGDSGECNQATKKDAHRLGWLAIMTKGETLGAWRSFRVDRQKAAVLAGSGTQRAWCQKIRTEARILRRAGAWGKRDGGLQRVCSNLRNNVGECGWVAPAILSRIAPDIRQLSAGGQRHDLRHLAGEPKPSGLCQLP